MQIEVSEDGFINALQNIKQGFIVNQLDHALMECIQAIRENGGKPQSCRSARAPTSARVTSSRISA